MSRLIKNSLKSETGFAALALRLPIGVILAVHGAQKLFVWFVAGVDWRARAVAVVQIY